MLLLVHFRKQIADKIETRNDSLVNAIFHSKYGSLPYHLFVNVLGSFAIYFGVGGFLHVSRHSFIIIFMSKLTLN